ncbi:hypothetical protein G7054_g10657 [Neopestalotiopsis clavispora]|nr:hypothetical protein G7054_g10657 [Neopestalotiopsis clavispora]
MSSQSRRNWRAEPYSRPRSNGLGRILNNGTQQPTPHFFIHAGEPVNNSTTYPLPQMQQSPQIPPPVSAREASPPQEDDDSIMTEIRQGLQCEFAGVANNLARAYVELFDLTDYLADVRFTDPRVVDMLSQFIAREGARLRDVEDHLSDAIFHLWATPALDPEICLSCEVMDRIAEMRGDPGCLAVGSQRRIQDPRLRPWVAAPVDRARAGGPWDDEDESHGCRDCDDSGWEDVSGPEIKREDEMSSSYWQGLQF